ncbi:hypothetical protein [Elizabethkingia anophelis]|uniref:hypothetical protein n=1 Tax=Elizabethkingia anophelis TaxID=1117645 RepID=UPI000DD6415D|nr:hypothetical protein [Elizabethkingia anophelis]MCT4127920.1 hypothetical protein [Elizabethkingia anophelis]MDV3844984.1 hypothetical protein [Elizabethkingia anophelis]RBA34781.1 hypothetical protein DSC50_08835 [Elizabethkingia anophelis]UKY91071.1 hypothetical protein KUF64_05015 [Elizabethkingia anophelis]UKY98242.1 hypothetical protein KUF68_05020 [Elizabethkingia anophelis]
MGTLYYATLKTSETGKAFQKLVDEAARIRKEINAYLDAIGADDYASDPGSAFGTGIVEVGFEKEPDLKIWKKSKYYEGFYTPRLSSKEGKKIKERFNEFDNITEDDLNRIVGMRSIIRTVGCNTGKGAFCGFATDSEWGHQMPIDCTEITGTEFENL